MAAAFNLKIPRELKLCRDLFLSQSLQKPEPRLCRGIGMHLLSGETSKEREREIRNASESDSVPRRVRRR